MKVSKGFVQAIRCGPYQVVDILGRAFAVCSCCVAVGSFADAMV